MNSWKFHSHSSRLVYQAIATKLNLNYTDFYKSLKDFDLINSNILTKDGKKYKLVLEEI